MDFEFPLAEARRLPAERGSIAEGARDGHAAAGHFVGSAICVAILLLGSGCRGSSDEQARQSEPPAGADGEPSAEDLAVGSPSDHGGSAPSLLARRPGEANRSTTDPDDDQALVEALFGDAPSQATPPAAPPRDEGATLDRPPDPSHTRRPAKLPPDLPAERLIELLGALDEDMRDVTSGRRGLVEAAEANVELNRLSSLKLQAATRLEELVEPGSADYFLAIRASLQSLSHLAGLGDLDAAKQLEELAWTHIRSAEASVAHDSLLVLTGLAIERLQNGQSEDAREIIELVNRIADSNQRPDVSSLMVMGQAKTVLQRYGDNEGAAQVRSTIIRLFADHPNPNVAQLALQLAGSAEMAATEQLVRGFTEGQSLEVEPWQAAIDQLWVAEPTAATVGYLASAALQFEAAGASELVAATFDALQGQPLGGEAAEEFQAARGAYQARQAVIGTTPEIDLPSVDGQPLSLDGHGDQVVLMPFWAISIPESLVVMQRLDRLRDRFDGSVLIIGMNIDPPGAPAAEFLSESPVPFRSFRSPSKPDGTPHWIAQQFGVVSLPFVVVWDTQGRVAAINLTGDGLEDQVQRALGP